jgi:hypothetical protein
MLCSPCCEKRMNLLQAHGSFPLQLGVDFFTTSTMTIFLKNQNIHYKYIIIIFVNCILVLRLLEKSTLKTNFKNT